MVVLAVVAAAVVPKVIDLLLAVAKTLKIVSDKLEITIPYPKDRYCFPSLHRRLNILILHL